jgi:NADPH:quinone reductase
VAIDVSHAAVGLVDVYIRQGVYEGSKGLPRPPYVPGLEVAGTIRALGEGVTEFRVGEQVVTLSGTGAEGGYASIAVVDAAMTVSLEGTGVDPALAVAAVPNAATAYLALTEVAHLKPGERVLVHGALGGLASAFPGVARTLGAALVVGTVRRTSLADGQASTLPYDTVIASEDLLDAVDGQRFDVVIDPIGGQVRTDSLQVMAPLGRMLLVGNASGDWEQTVSTNALWRDNIGLLGFAVGSYLPAHPELVRPAAQGALKAISQGLVDIHTQTLPLAQAAEAHRRLETGAIGGRILLTPT